MSDADVRQGKSENAEDEANLILHHGVADILDHVTKLFRIICNLQGPRDCTSLCQRSEIFENIFQLPNNLFASTALALDLVECLLTAREYPSSLPPRPHPREWAHPGTVPVPEP